VVSEIVQCRYMQDKIAIIKEHIHSLADMEDILLDADLTHEEIMAVLCELSPLEIAALSKKHSVMSEVEACDYKEQEQALRKCLHNYISTLPQDQRELFSSGMGEIHFFTHSEVSAQNEH